jgi:hypothetical protein
LIRKSKKERNDSLSFEVIAFLGPFPAGLPFFSGKGKDAQVQPVLPVICVTVFHCGSFYNHQFLFTNSGSGSN